MNPGLASRQRMTRASAKTKKVGVCLMSSHPLFLTQFHDRLLSSGFKLYVSKVTAGEGAEIFPRTDIYVVDSFAHPRVTEQLVASILAGNPTAAIIVMSDEFTESVAFPLLQLGVKGILHYREAEGQLTRALQAVSNGGYWVPRVILGGMLAHILRDKRQKQHGAFPASISPRERQILDAVLDNLSNKEIANRWNISERTVKFHVSNLLSKCGVQRRADLILLCYQAERIASGKID